MTFKKKFNLMLKRLDKSSFKYTFPIHFILFYFVITKSLPYFDNQYTDPNIGVGFFALMLLIMTPIYMFLFLVWAFLIRQKIIKRFVL